MGLPKSSQAVVLCEDVLQCCLHSVVSVSLCTAAFQGSFQSDESVALHSTECPGGLLNVVSVALLPCVQRDVFKLCCFQGIRQSGNQLLSCLTCSRSLVKPVAFFVADPLGCLRLWCQLPNRPASSLPQKKGPSRSVVVFRRWGFWWLMGPEFTGLPAVPLRTS